MQYILELGRNIELSIAEVLSVFGEDSLVSVHSEYLIVDVDKEIENIDNFGGVVAAYKVHTLFEGFVEDDDLVKLIVNNFDAKNIGISSNFLSYKILDGILRKSKKILKSQEKSVRFLLNTKTATVLGAGFKNRKVTVFGLFRFGGKVHFCTLAGVQDIDAYTVRDFDKPFRDAKQGMLPPKLAQIMINLAGPGKVYDPFCGTGTVLMEALLLKREIMGSDIEAKNIDGTKRNLYWFVDQFNIVDNYKMDVFAGDARNVTTDNFDVLVSEGYLGEPKRGNESLINMKEEMRVITDLYFDFLQNLINVKKKQFTVVFTAPVFFDHGKQICMENLVEKLTPLGYSVSALIPKGNKLGHESLETFLYKRKDQKVFRQIFRLTYNPR